MNGFTLAFCPCLYRNRLFNTVIWAMITDVIDDAEVKIRCAKMERCIPYIRLRKLGQALSSALVGDDFSSGWISGTAYA